MGVGDAAALVLAAVVVRVGVAVNLSLEAGWLAVCWLALLLAVRSFSFFFAVLVGGDDSKLRFCVR